MFFDEHNLKKNCENNAISAMPGISNKAQSADEEREGEGEPNAAVVQQPANQPQNLQGLLRFAVEAGGSGTTANNIAPLGEEEQRFLQNALSSMTVDVVSVLKTSIRALDEVSTLDVDSDISDVNKAFDTLFEYVDRIDVANDFHKIGGFAVFERCMRCKHPAVRAQVCHLIGELAQNNPYIQDIVCECTRILPHLLQLLAEDESVNVRIKALFAISCITRDSSLGSESLQLLHGYTAIKSALTSNEDKLRAKAAFLIANLISGSDAKTAIVAQLIDAGYIPAVTSALDAVHQPSHEQVLQLLLQILRHSTSACEILQASPTFAHTLQAIRDFIANDASGQYLEEQEYCDEINKMLAVKQQ